MRSWLPALLCIALSAPAVGLEPTRELTQYGYSHWDTERGLPQNTVSVIRQTSDGYIWIGTQEGMARFDGVRFVTYDSRNTPALGTKIYDLMEDGQGNLWVGTSSGAVRKDRAGNFRRFGAKEGFPESQVSTVVHARDESMWFGATKGLYHLVGDKVTRYGREDGLPDSAILLITEDPTGALYLMTRGNSLTRYKDGQFKTYTIEEGAPKVGINSLLAARNGDLWIGTETTGLFLFSRGTFTPMNMANGLLQPSDRIRSLLEDSRGALWVGTDGGGVARRFNGRWSKFFGPLWASDEAMNIFEDREGSVWLGTFTSGLHQLTDVKFLAIGKPEGLSDDVVWSVMEDKANEIWIGAANGLNRVQDGRVVWAAQSFNGITLGPIWGLHKGRDGSLWVATRRGLFHVRGEQADLMDPTPVLGTSVVQAVYEDRRGDVWFGSPGGVGRLRNGVMQSLTRDLKMPSGSSIFIDEDPDGTMWVALRGGGLLHFTGDDWTVLTTADGLAGNWVVEMHRDSRGVLWIGTQTGLSRIEGKRIDTFRSAQGLFDENIHRILEDGDNNLWMSTNRGIFRMKRSDLDKVARGELKTAPSAVFGSTDGMRSSECNGSGQPAGWKLQDGRLVFPCIRGAVVIDPAKLRYNQVEPKVKIEQLSHDGVVVNLNETIVVPPGSRTMEIAYSGLSFVNPQKVHMRHKLEGYDQEWVEAGTRRIAYYTNLPPGNYAFHVLAANDDGLWNHEPATIRFRLAPFFHQTWMFMALCILSGAGVVGGAYYLRVRYLKRREAELREHNVKLSAALLAAQEAVRVKGEFVANTSHELRTPLNAIINIPQGLLDHFTSVPKATCSGCQATFELEEGDSTTDIKCPECASPLEVSIEWQFEQSGAPDVVKGLKWLRQSGTHLLRVVNDVLDFSKLEAGKVALEKSRIPVETLFAELGDTLASLAREKEIELVFKQDAPNLAVRGDPVKCSQIFINLLSNALKFSPKGSKVETQALAEGLALVFTIKDQGVGIAPENHELVFESFRQIDGGHTRRQGGTGLGLSITRKLVELHNGRIWLESQLGQGTTFFVRLPSDESLEEGGLPPLDGALAPLAGDLSSEGHRVPVTKSTPRERGAR